jgi:hypothetical protein
MFASSSSQEVRVRLGRSAWMRPALAAAAAAAALLVLAVAGAQAGVNEYDFEPDTTFGGRAVAVTRSPSDTSRAITAAETGGLFRSTDSGLSWTHIAAFPMFRMEDVTYDPGDASIVIATTQYDGRVTSRAGIWQSTDGGTSWARAVVQYTCTTTPNAWGIGTVDGADTHRKIFVANDCGVAYTNDSGATWTNQDPTGAIGTGFFDVAAVRTGPDTARAYACGPSGVYTATVSGTAAPVWTAASTVNPAAVNDRCQISVSPRNANVVFLTNRNAGARVYESDDSGATWTDLNGPLANNRPAFVVTGRPLDGDATHFELYWGNGVLAFRQHCTANGTAALDCPVAPDTNCTDAADDDGDQMVNEGCPPVGPDTNLDGSPDAENSGSVPSQCKNAADDDGDATVNDGCPVMERFDNGTHVDATDVTRDLAVAASGCPTLIANDGGIGRSSNCGASWVDSNAGMRALQIFNVFGTVRGPGATETDIYFGTMDNSWWMTLDNGGSWSNAGCCEGYLGQVDRRVPAGGLSPIGMVYVNAAPPFNAFSRRGFTPFSFPWPNPPGNGGLTGQSRLPLGTPIQFGNHRYGQITSDFSSPVNFQLYVMQPETGAQCDNATDDDADTGFRNAGAGSVNDGCPAVGLAESEPGCHDDTDEDSDGKVNDGCSEIFSSEVGTECTDSRDSDGDNVVNDACPLAGSFPETGAECLNTIDAADEDPNTAGVQDDDTRVNDGCPEVGVWGPMGPTFTQLWAHPLIVSGPVTAPTFYFAVDMGGSTFRLRKISGPMNTTATLTPADGPGPPATSLVDIGGYCPADQTWYCPLVVAVDPANPNRLYAADDGTQELKFTSDGGATWQADAELTTLVRNGAEFRWSSRYGPEAWTIAYDPENTQRIFVGTELAGIMASVNGGTDWFRLAGTLNRVPYVTSFFIDQDHGLVYASTYGRGLWTIAFKPPVANAGGPYTTSEGTDVTLDGSASSDPDGGPLTYEWDFDDDGAFDDATGPNPTFDRVGQDGAFPIFLRVTDPDGATDIDGTTVTVTNAAPTVTLASNSPKPANVPVTVSGTVSDPGWLDSLTATIDWGDGTPVEPITGTLENDRPDATLTFAKDHTYAQSGTYTATVCGRDDDTQTCQTILLTVDSTPPTCVIAETGRNADGRSFIRFTVQDTGSGIARLVVVYTRNATVAFSSFPPGTTEPLDIVATAIDPAQSVGVTVDLFDVVGNTAFCDPVLAVVVREHGKPVMQSFEGLPEAESKVLVQNGTPGITNLKVTVNGTSFRVKKLADGASSTLDVSSAMLPGSQNTITVTAHGKPGASALVVISN